LIILKDTNDLNILWAIIQTLPTTYIGLGGPSFELADVNVNGLGRLTDANETLTKTDSSTVAHSLDYQYNMLSQLTDANITDISGYDWVCYLYSYDPFGDLLESDGSFDNPFIFTGQWFDSEIGLYYLRARMYDSVVMRFTAQDPVTGRTQLEIDSFFTFSILS